jgi:hypothetical protein
MSDLCRICRGSGALLTADRMPWDCLYCGGAGVRVQLGPPIFSRAASAIEARRGETKGLDAEHESATSEAGDAQ